VNPQLSVKLATTHASIFPPLCFIIPLFDKNCFMPHNSEKFKIFGPNLHAFQDLTLWPHVNDSVTPHVIVIGVSNLERHANWVLNIKISPQSGTIIALMCKLLYLRVGGLWHIFLFIQRLMFLQETITRVYNVVQYETGSRSRELEIRWYSRTLRVNTEDEGAWRMWEINRGRFTNAREGATAEIQMRSPLLVARMIPSFRDSDPNTVPSTERTQSH
jgi:hypothetical protein